MNRPKIGDVIEIDTGDGLAYCHYSHRDKMFGYLLRVFNQRYVQRPVDLAAAVGGKPAFYQFFPLGTYVHRGVVTIAGNVPLSEEATVFPLFRSGLADRTGKITNWWLWDGVREWPIGPLPDELRKLSLRGVCNDLFLIDRILSGWTPEKDPI